MRRPMTIHAVSIRTSGESNGSQAGQTTFLVSWSSVCGGGRRHLDGVYGPAAARVLQAGRSADSPSARVRRTT